MTDARLLINCVRPSICICPNPFGSIACLPVTQRGFAPSCRLSDQNVIWGYKSSESQVRNMMKSLFTTVMFCCIAAIPAQAQKTKIQQPTSPAHYADIVDLGDAAELVAEVKIRSAKKVKQKGQNPGAPVRFLVDATILSLIRGPEGVPPRLRYIAESVPDSRGKLPKLERGVMIVFAHTVADRPGEIQLVAPDAQLWWNEQLGADVRAVMRSLAAPGVAGRVKGISSAFHSAGALAGEGETQIFLATQGGSSVSLMVSRFTGQPARWTAAYGDVVDPDAPPPARNSIGWYRLACFLPRTIPETVLGEITPEQKDQVITDYGFVMRALGDCPRYRPRPQS